MPKRQKQYWNLSVATCTECQGHNKLCVDCTRAHGDPLDYFYVCLNCLHDTYQQTKGLLSKLGKTGEEIAETLALLHADKEEA